MTDKQALLRMARRDVSATFVETFLQFKTRDSDGFFPARVLDITGNRHENVILVVRELNDDIRCINLSDKDIDVSFKFPIMGAFNYMKHAWHVARSACRQWKRGLRPHLLSTHMYGNDVIDNIKGYHTNGFSDDVLKSLYYPKYTSYPEAIQGVLEGEYIARAISPEFVIENKPNCNAPVMTYKTRAIGVYNDDTLEIPRALSHIDPMIRRIVPNGSYNSRFI